MYLCFAGYMGGSYPAEACRHRTQDDEVDSKGRDTDDKMPIPDPIPNPYLVGKTGFADDLEVGNQLTWSANLAEVHLGICLSCCSNSGCVDDDYDDETGFCKDEGYNDKWRIECGIDRTQYRTASNTGFKNHQV